MQHFIKLEMSAVPAIRALEGERAARLEAERRDTAKDELLAVVCHELRNPLSAVLGWVRLLRSGELGEEEAARALATIERNAVTQSRLLEDLLDVQRISAGKLRLEAEPIDFATTVRAVLESARPAISAKQLHLEVRIPSATVPTMGDATRLEQIVANLLTNATKFTRRGGRIDVVLARVGAMVELSVTDDGEGISAAFLPQVFERFKQADTPAARAHCGLGIGLSVAKSLVEMHGGTIHARSAGMGLGATFVVRLPLRRARATARGAASSDEHRDQPAAARRRQDRA